jgi:hypothetical protein
VEFTNAGQAAFPLEAGASTYVSMRLRPGLDFTVSDVLQAGQPRIHVEAYADDILIGGMSYLVDPNYKGGGAGTGDGPCDSPTAVCTQSANSLLSCIDVSHHKVRDVRVRRVNVDLLFDDCDC